MALWLPWLPAVQMESLVARAASGMRCRRTPACREKDGKKPLLQQENAFEDAPKMRNSPNANSFR